VPDPHPADPHPTGPIVVAARFNGPDGSANGGYACGLVAARVDRPIAGVGAVVTLRVPPPLDRPLVLQADAADAVRVLDGPALIAEGVRTPLGVEAVPAVPYAVALAAESRYAGHRAHPFPRCFACGTERDPDDGLGLRPGPVGPDRTACTWVPAPDLASSDGRARPEIVWAALDCPAGWTADLAGRPLVLGRMAARLDTVPAVGEPCVIVGRRLGSEGRKTWTATTAYGDDGRELGRAHATWIIRPA
jgi:hypothetical protein